MKEFACGDVVPGCTMFFRAPSTEAVLEQVAAHARRDHGLAEVPLALVEQVKTHIKAA